MWRSKRSSPRPGVRLRGGEGRRGGRRMGAETTDAERQDQLLELTEAGSEKTEELLSEVCEGTTEEGEIDEETIEEFETIVEETYTEEIIEETSEYGLLHGG